MVIAHRLSTISNSDQIIVVEEGNVVATGTHDRLLKDCPLYLSMWESHVGAGNGPLARQPKGGFDDWDREADRRMGRSYRNRLLAGSLCSFLATWFTAAPVALTAYYIALILGSPEGRPPFGGEAIWLSLSAIAGFIVLRFVFTYLKCRLQESIGYEVAVKQRIRIGGILKRVSRVF